MDLMGFLGMVELCHRARAVAEFWFGTLLI